MKVLHIDSSIQGSASASRVLSAAIVDRLRATNGDLNVTYLDLASAPLDHLTLNSFGESASQRALEQFLAADVVVLGVALYNFTISSQLKAWIDRILVAGKTFRYTETGPEGLAGDKRVIIGLARGGVYSNGSPMGPNEHAETLLRSTLGFIGVENPEFIIAEGLALGEEARREGLASALDAANKIAPSALAA